MDNIVFWNIREILIEFPETRDSDKKLIVHYYNIYEWWFNEENVLLSEVKFETIVRFRRKLQEDPRYWWSHKIREARKMLSNIYANFFRYLK